MRMNLMYMEVAIIHLTTMCVLTMAFIIAFSISKNLSSGSFTKIGDKVESDRDWAVKAGIPRLCNMFISLCRAVCHCQPTSGAHNGRTEAAEG